MKQTYKTSIEEVDARLFVLGARPAKDDPIVKRWREYGKPVSHEEIQEMMDKALGDRSITDELYKIR